MSKFPGKFFGRQSGETKWPADMNEMVMYWITTWTEADQDERGWSLMLIDDLREEDPDLCVDFIIEVLKRDPPQLVADQLAASVLEDLLIESGPVVIDRVEAEALHDPKFRHLLGGMYVTRMEDEIRRRINRLAEKW